MEIRVRRGLDLHDLSGGSDAVFLQEEEVDMIEGKRDEATALGKG